MSRRILAIVALALLLLLAGAPVGHAQAGSAAAAAPPAKPDAPAALDKLLAPIALYPDALVSQVLTCAGNPAQVKEVSAWLKASPDLKGTAAQDAASDKGFDAPFTAIVLFPDVLHMMADKADWTAQLGEAFAQDRSGVFKSVQRLRAQAQAQGNLKTNEQQAVETVKSSGGQEVIVIQPANPQVVYVPQYNPTVVYTQPAPPPPPPSASSDGGKLAAGLIGFTAGVIVGAAADNDNDHYHYGYGGWGYHGPMLSDDGWHDFAEHREDMAKDYYDHRENIAKQRGENTTARRETSGENQAARSEGRAQNTAARGENQAARQASMSQNQAARQSAAQSAGGAPRSSTAQAAQRSYQGKAASSASTASRGGGGGGGGRSDAFTGYQRGSTERASSSRGNSSLSRSGGGRGSRGGSRG
jgi:hypothetical protein